MSVTALLSSGRRRIRDVAEVFPMFPCSNTA
jgi:hypothetical protein